MSTLDTFSHGKWWTISFMIGLLLLSFEVKKNTVFFQAINIFFRKICNIFYSRILYENIHPHALIINSWPIRALSTVGYFSIWNPLNMKWTLAGKIFESLLNATTSTSGHKDLNIDVCKSYITTIRNAYIEHHIIFMFI